MGGGGDGKIEETDQQKAFADVTRKKWEQYQKDYKPAENRFMDDVNRRNSDTAYQQAANLASVPVESSFSGQINQAAKQMTSSRVNPNSGLFKEELNKIDRKKESAKSDFQNQAQVSQQDRYTGGLQNIVAMGQGQATQATQGLGDLAGMANQRAANDAQNESQNRQGNRQIAGAVVGAGTAYGLRQSQEGRP